MILGIGTDIVGLERFGKLVGSPRGEAFARRVLSEAERAHAGAARLSEARYVEFLAGRWAAKEAVAKAFGCGIGGELGFRDIEIVPDERGRPCCTVKRDIGRGVRVHVSISHADGWASAFAVAERVERAERMGLAERVERVERTGRAEPTERVERTGRAEDLGGRADAPRT